MGFEIRAHHDEHAGREACSIMELLSTVRRKSLSHMLGTTSSMARTRVTSTSLQKSEFGRTRGDQDGILYEIKVKKKNHNGGIAGVVASTT